LVWSLARWRTREISASMRLPTFIVGGAQKAGTSWLSRNLARHPEVFVAPGEIHFFDSDTNFRRGIAWYAAHFAESGASTAIGEKSPGYLNLIRTTECQAHVPKRVRAIIPDVRLIFILRDPVHRAISAARHHIFRRRISPMASLDDVLFGRHSDFSRAWGLLSAGRYAANLQPYLEVFDRRQLRIWILEEDVASDPEGMMRDVISFLDLSVTTDYKVMLRRFNVGLRTRACLAANYYFPQLSLVWGCVDRTVQHFAPIQEEESLRSRLYDYYRADNEALFAMLGRRIPSWEH